jgi:hypothetical protein
MASKPPLRKVITGGCKYTRKSPKSLDELSPKTDYLTLSISLAEALKLNLAIDECVRVVISTSRRGRFQK